MRKLSRLFAAWGILLGLAAPAAAVPVAFSGTLSLALSALPPITVVATGTADVASSAGQITSIALAGGTFATSVTIPVTDPVSSPITQVIASLTNGAASFGTLPGANLDNDFLTDLSGTGSGPMALTGQAKIGLFPGPLANLTVPFTSGGVNGVGLGGGYVVATSAVTVSVRGAPWTTGTASIGTATAMGFLAGNTVQLVSPTTLTTSLGGDTTIPMFSVLTLSFVPEPGSWLLISCGLAGLTVLRAGGRRS